MSRSLDLRMARSSVDPGSETAALLDGASRELSEALEAVRQPAWGIHPAVLTDEGLRTAIGALAVRRGVPGVESGARGPRTSAPASSRELPVA